MATSVVPGPYNSPSVPYHQQGALYNKTVRVTATTNNPLTLTGSYANNSGFIVFNTGSVALTSVNGTAYIGSDFHQPGVNHVIYPIGLSYVSCSSTGDVSVLYSS